MDSYRTSTACRTVVGRRHPGHPGPLAPRCPSRAPVAPAHPIFGLVIDPSFPSTADGPRASIRPVAVRRCSDLIRPRDRRCPAERIPRLRPWPLWRPAHPGPRHPIFGLVIDPSFPSTADGPRASFRPVAVRRRSDPIAPRDRRCPAGVDPTPGTLAASAPGAPSRRGVRSVAAQRRSAPAEPRRRSSPSPIRSTRSRRHRPVRGPARDRPGRRDASDPPRRWRTA